MTAELAAEALLLEPSAECEAATSDQRVVLRAGFYVPLEDEMVHGGWVLSTRC